MEGKIPSHVPIAMHTFLFAARCAGMRLQDCLQSGETLDAALAHSRNRSDGSL